MKIGNFFGNGFVRLRDRFPVWWSDIKFYWSTRDRTPVIVVAAVSVTVVTFSVLISLYLENAAARRQISCLALNVYYEARGEPLDGQYAVAEVTMNRVASKHYPNSICEVVYQQNWDIRRRRYVGMFSWTELDRKPDIHSAFWERSLDVAHKVYNQDYTARVNGALFFHSLHIRPGWARNKRPKATIGKHVFY